jgi:type II secretory pathway pseudopilin PulG
MWFLEKSYVLEPGKKSVGIHKNLAYTTLFIGGLILIGDLITVLYYFIDGQDLTPGFLLKVASVLVITLIVFLYYVADVRNTLTSGKRLAWLVISIVLVIVSIAWGFSVLGSPRTQQLLKYDSQKVTDLSNIKNNIENYYYDKKVLPNTLLELSNSSSYYYNKPANDPQTNQPYEYVKTMDFGYSLCAVFNKSSDDQNNLNKGYPYSYPSGNWNHSPGRYCFSETVTPPANVFAPLPAPKY